MSLLLRDATVVPMTGGPEAPLGNVRRASIRIDGERIAAIGELSPIPGEEVLECSGLCALPGFVQGHVHFCQTLFRGLADDLALLPWLQERIWPLEAAHVGSSVRASADLSIAELLSSGTTSVQVMESVHWAEESFAAAVASPMTVILGNCLMDVGGPHVPAALVSSPADSLARSETLCKAFDGRDGRIHYAVSPRFVLSCSDGLARDAAAFALQNDLRIHTHAGEHPDEVRAVREQTGRDYLLALADQGLLGPRTTLAHCVHTTEAERQVLCDTGTAVLHCPSTNLKLGSGIAPVTEYRRLGVRVALGADGAPANNRLSALTELRTAALLQACSAGPGAWPAAQALWTATRGGAEALGLEASVGALAVGLRADVALWDLDHPDLSPGGDPASRLVYAAQERHLRHLVAGGQQCVRDGTLMTADRQQLAERACRERDALLQRSGLAR